MQVWNVMEATWNLVNFGGDVLFIFLGAKGVYSDIRRWLKYLFPRANISTPSKDCAGRVGVSDKTSPYSVFSDKTSPYSSTNPSRANYLLRGLQVQVEELEHEVQFLRHACALPSIVRVARLRDQIKLLHTVADDLVSNVVASKRRSLPVLLPSLRRRRKAILERCGVLLQSLEALQASMQGDAFPVTPGNTEGATARDDRDAEVRSFLSRRGLEA